MMGRTYVRDEIDHVTADPFGTIFIRGAPRSALSGLVVAEKERLTSCDPTSWRTLTQLSVAKGGLLALTILSARLPLTKAPNAHLALGAVEVVDTPNLADPRL